jgi:hypothetical protein
LGTALFNAGFGFVLGSYSENTADYHVLNGIDSERPANILYFRPRQELGRTDADEEGALVDHLVERNSPDAPWPVVRPMQVEAADVVIAIGGREGTQQVIEIARSVNKQLIPIPSFPGAARDAWPAARQSLAKQGMGSPLIGRLNHGFDVDAVVEAVNFCVSGQHRDPSGLLPVEEIWSALLRTGRIASNDEITGELLLFDNLEGRPQHTWLVATRDKVFFLLDDERTRAKNGLVQRTLDRDSLLPLSVDKSGHTVGFGSQPKPRWYYSPILFPTPDELTAAVESLVAGHRSA